jgi:Spy/CpxP family protein refolding chaperone
MKTKLSIVLAILLSTGALFAADTPKDPLAGQLFPPELLMFHGESIGLSDEQRTAVHSEVEKVHQRFLDLNQRLQKEVDAMKELVKKQRIQEKAALQQLDKMLDTEREIKHAQLGLLISLKNQLTAEQQVKASELKEKLGDGPLGPPASFTAKIEKIQSGVKEWQEDGRNPSPVGELMQGFEPLMKQGRLKEAEALLDRALKLLESESKK